MKALGNHDALHFSTSGSTTMTVAVGAGTDWESGPFLLELVLRNTTAAATFGDFWANGLGQRSLALGCNDGMTTVPDFWMLAYASISWSSLNSGNAVSYNDGSLHSVGVWRDSDSNVSLLIDGVSVMTQSLSGPVSAAGGADARQLQRGSLGAGRKEWRGHLERRGRSRKLLSRQVRDALAGTVTSRG